MSDASISEAARARLLLVEPKCVLGGAVAAPLAHEFTTAPVTVELTSGRQATDVLRGSAFDFIAADLEALADLGTTTDERIARLARSSAGAILLVLSDDASISVAMAAMRAGAHDCMSRSCAPRMVVQRLGELARRHGKAQLLAQPSLPDQDDAGGDPAGPSIPVMRDLVLPMWRQEQRIIEDAIQSFAGNIALAAAALELSPSTIYRKRQAWAEMSAKRA
jgi:DNA-binding NtrC family response regulator